MLTHHPEWVGMVWLKYAKVIAPQHSKTYYRHPLGVDNLEVLNGYRHLKTRNLGPHQVDKMKHLLIINSA